MAAPSLQTEIQVHEFAAEHSRALRAFNQRLANGGFTPDLLFPEDPADFDFPVDEPGPVYHNRYVVLEGCTVRGAYYLTRERYWLHGKEVSVAHFRHPISEVVINKRFRGIGSRIFADAYTREPHLYSTGMGGTTNPTFKRMLAEGWDHCLVPFYFRIGNASKFLANAEVLRKHRLGRIVADLARCTGAGALLRFGQTLRTAWTRGIEYEIVPDFGPWADSVWNSGKDSVSVCAVRTAEVLNARYQDGRRPFVRIRVSSAGTTLGWAIVLATSMHNNKYFGNMTVGTLVDCFAVPNAQRAVVHAATKYLTDMRVDVLVTNQSHRAWGNALSRCGWWSGPSNYLFTTSPVLRSSAGMLSVIRSGCHLNRGDGAGVSRL